MTDDEIGARLHAAIALRDGSALARAHEGKGPEDIIMCLGSPRCWGAHAPRLCPYCGAYDPTFKHEHVSSAVRALRQGH